MSALSAEEFEAELRRLAQADAAGTSECLPALPAGAFREELTGAVMARWSREDLPAALAWAKGCEDPALRQSALLHLSYRWFETDPEEALAYAALDPSANRQLLANLVGLWTREQPAAAATWAAEFSSDPVMTGIAANAVSAWAEQDGATAAEFVLGVASDRLRREAMISVVAVLARSDPQSGALWTETFPAGPEKNYAIENLLYSWAVTDPAAAFTWINRLPQAERDAGIFAGAGGLLDTQPELAASWVAAIQDENRRLQQAERVATHWLKTDRWSAEAWIRRSAMPEPIKSRLLASVPAGS